MTESSAKPVSKPSCWQEHSHLLGRLRNSMAHQESPSGHFAKEHPARTEVQFWLSCLSPKQVAADEKPLSKELALVARAIAAIAEAQESQILTESEAEAVVQFLLSKFVERRFNKTIHETFRGSDQEWFLTASRYFHE